MDARMGKGRRWAGNTLKVFGIAVVARLFFAFKANQFKGLVESVLLLIVGVVAAAIAFELGWLSAGKAGAPAANAVGSKSPGPPVTGGSAASQAASGEVATATVSDADTGIPAPESASVPGAASAPAPVIQRPAREPGVADFDGARRRHELNAIVNAAFAAYPFLNSDNEDFDEGALDEVMKYRDFYAANGYPLPSALRKAIDEVCPRYASSRTIRQS